MLERHVAAAVADALSRQAAVALLGPRQVGKTTFAVTLGEQRGALYLDLEDRDDRNRLADPARFFDMFEDRLVILDEIHRAPEIFETLRGVIDRGRRKGKGRGRFLILGCAAVEVEDSREMRDRLWLRGGFPDAFRAGSDAESFALRKDFIRTYLARDIPMFGPRAPAETMERLWTMLAHGQGGLRNAAQLARGLDVSAQSVTRYIDLLCDLLLARRLPPLHANVAKRLVKSPKIYLRDSG